MGGRQGPLDRPEPGTCTPQTMASTGQLPEKSPFLKEPTLSRTFPGVLSPGCPSESTAGLCKRRAPRCNPHRTRAKRDPVSPGATWTHPLGPALEQAGGLPLFRDSKPQARLRTGQEGTGHPQEEEVGSHRPGEARVRSGWAGSSTGRRRSRLAGGGLRLELVACLGLSTWDGEGQGGQAPKCWQQPGGQAAGGACEVKAGPERWDGFRLSSPCPKALGVAGGGRQFLFHNQHHLPSHPGAGIAQKCRPVDSPGPFLL